MRRRGGIAAEGVPTDAVVDGGAKRLAEHRPTVLVFEVHEHSHQGIAAALLFVEDRHVGHQGVFDLDGGHQGEGAAVVGPPVNRPAAAHDLTGEIVDHLVRDEDMGPVGFDTVGAAREGVVGAADTGAWPASDRVDFADVSGREAATGVVHHQQRIFLPHRLEPPRFAELVKRLVGVVIHGRDVGFVGVELVLAGIPRPVLALVNFLEGRILGRRNGHGGHGGKQG